MIVADFMFYSYKIRHDHDSRGRASGPAAGRRVGPAGGHPRPGRPRAGRVRPVRRMRDGNGRCQHLLNDSAHLKLALTQISNRVTAGDGLRGQAASRTRLRSRLKPARPYICLLIILIRFTLPSAAPEL